jgi:hypothetical protein
MKKLFTIVALFAAAISFGQVKNNAYSFRAATAAGSTFTTKLPDFSYYSKNYDKVFGEYTYSFNTMSFSRRSVYVSDTSFYYNASQNLPYIQHLSQNYLYGPESTAEGIIGISVIGIQALMSGDLFTKDYSPKDVDRSLFHQGE